MNESENFEEKPANNEQLPENNSEKSSENISSTEKSVENSVNELNVLLGNSFQIIEENVPNDNVEVNNTSLFVGTKKLSEYESMDIDNNKIVSENCKNDVIVEQISVENNDCTIVETKLPDKTQLTNDENTESKESKILSYDWTTPKLICLATEEFKPTDTCENFTKGCHWAPDGTCILVPSEDYKIRIFELPQPLYSGTLPQDFQTHSFKSTLKIKEGGTIYDTCWFPYMNSWDPSTCCFLSTSQGSPIHLWDAFTGQLRATYRAYNQVDEVEAAISIQFTDYGSQIWSGFKNVLRIFQTDCPGRQTNTIYLKKDFPNVTGLVSCIRENPSMPGLIAFGTYSKCIGLYKDGPLCTFKTGSGVTQIEFSPCGTKLYSAVRRGNEFLCWDLRNPGTVLYSLENRQSDTNQRIYFSISYDEKEIISGGTDGAVKVWKIPSNCQVDEELNSFYKIKISKDCVNGVNLHKNLPVLAVTTGCRICDEVENISRDNSLRFYWLSSR